MQYTPNVAAFSCAYCGTGRILYTAGMEHRIRAVSDVDLGVIHALNEAAVPAVNSVPMATMRWFRRHATYFRVADRGDGPDAFLIGLGPGCSYDSVNYRWFCERYEAFGYVDRIAVATHARRQGIAVALYEDFRMSLASQVPVMTCEVNLEPPNESSMRFHERLGFTQVGTQTTEGGSKRVALMERRL